MLTVARRVSDCMQAGRRARARRRLKASTRTSRRRLRACSSAQIKCKRWRSSASSEYDDQVSIAIKYSHTNIWPVLQKTHRQTGQDQESGTRQRCEQLHFVRRAAEIVQEQVLHMQRLSQCEYATRIEAPLAPQFASLTFERLSTNRPFATNAAWTRESSTRMSSFGCARFAQSRAR